MLIDMDGARHTRQRKLINAGFTPRMTSRLEEQARKWAVSIIEEGLARETCDFVHDLAFQLPMHMIADIMGIPNEDRAWLFERTDHALMCDDPEHPVPASQKEPLRAEIFAYAQQLNEEKRKNPADDIWTLLTENGGGGRGWQADPAQPNGARLLLPAAHGCGK